MPGPDGLALQEAVRRRGWDLPVVFLSGRGDVGSSVKALKAGAHDFLTKPVDGKTLLQAIQDAVAMDAPQRALRKLKQDVQERLETLNAREQAVLRMVLAGTLTRDIAEALDVSERTVKSCRASSWKK
jgi:FixJ family two-component response regulator